MKTTTAMRAALVLGAALLTGCVSMPTLPETIAKHKWQGRSAEEAIRFFGRPMAMERSEDGQHAVMKWYWDTSYTRTELVGASQERQGNVLVNTSYWDDVNHVKACIVTVTVDNEKRITRFKADNGKMLLSTGCAGVKLVPP
ncbi:hypothetical protein [Stenotrophomonas sp.]|uniref:hypothetical protein n=1 Tax=Stenotrophomonas sp. TaxID=69392 RepID=UPI0028A6A784|nr:hypothetical protein [Stenotrophomonas sp.]